MTKILFVCHGNICRSPMAEYLMKHLVREAGLEDQFQIASAATSREELGNPVYPPARQKLAEHGIACGGHMARQLQNRDYDAYDLLIGMDYANLRSMHRICGGDFDGKMHLLLEFAGRSDSGAPGKPQVETESGLCSGEVADPWYTRDFDAAWNDILDGCRGLLEKLLA